MSDPTPPTGTPAASDDDLNRLLALMPYAATLGISLQSAGAEEVIGSLAWAPELCTTGGLLHGGALIGLADTVGAVCAFLGLPSDVSTATTSSTTHARSREVGVATGTLLTNAKRVSTPGMRCRITLKR